MSNSTKTKRPRRTKDVVSVLQVFKDTPVGEDPKWELELAIKRAIPGYNPRVDVTVEMYTRRQMADITSRRHWAAVAEAKAVGAIDAVTAEWLDRIRAVTFTSPGCNVWRRAELTKDLYLPVKALKDKFDAVNLYAKARAEARVNHAARRRQAQAMVHLAKAQVPTATDVTADPSRATVTFTFTVTCPIVDIDAAKAIDTVIKAGWD